MRSPELVQGELEGEIAGLANRYGLTEASAEALQALVSLVDWEEPNFVPKSSQGRGRRKGRRDPASKRRVASNLLSESLAGLELEPLRTAGQVADIGSGAGFPGLVLAAALPQTRMTLIEKVPEKCAFLRHAASELSLDGVEVVEGAVQDWSEGLDACDVVTSRKVGRPERMLEWSAPLLAKEGWVALWPGSTDFDADTPKAAAGLRVVQVVSLESENRHGHRVKKHLYLYEKVAET
jgi:16S rRNA (guanine(527)-N(7))-methyltransferase RsmG